MGPGYGKINITQNRRLRLRDTHVTSEARQSSPILEKSSALDAGTYPSIVLANVRGVVAHGGDKTEGMGYVYEPKEQRLEWAKSLGYLYCHVAYLLETFSIMGKSM